MRQDFLEVCLEMTPQLFFDVCLEGMPQLFLAECLEDFLEPLQLPSPSLPDRLERRENTDLVPVKPPLHPLFELLRRPKLKVPTFLPEFDLLWWDALRLPNPNDFLDPFLEPDLPCPSLPLERLSERRELLRLDPLRELDLLELLLFFQELPREFPLEFPRAWRPPLELPRDWLRELPRDWLPPREFPRSWLPPRELPRDWLPPREFPRDWIPPRSGEACLTGCLTGSMTLTVSLASLAPKESLPTFLVSA
jgi:hypothetical protein